MVFSTFVFFAALLGARVVGHQIARTAAHEVQPAVLPARIAAPREHTVQAGEDIFVLALKYHVSPSELRDENNLKENNLMPGTVLKLPPDATMPAPQ